MTQFSLAWYIILQLQCGSGSTCFCLQDGAILNDALQCGSGSASFCLQDGAILNDA